MRKIVLTILLCSFALISVAGCTDNVNLDPNEIVNQNTQETKTTQEPEPIQEVKSIETIYADDEGINLFINRFNEINEGKITADMLHKAHIGGRDRDDVVSVSNDKFEINIYKNFGSNGKYNMSVYVGYYPKIDAIPDDYKEQFVKYIKVFDNTLTDEEINNHWDTLLSGYHSSYEINDIDVLVSSNIGTIEYFKFTKTLEL